MRHVGTSICRIQKIVLELILMGFYWVIRLILMWAKLKIWSLTPNWNFVWMDEIFYGDFLFKIWKCFPLELGCVMIRIQFLFLQPGGKRWLLLSVSLRGFHGSSWYKSILWLMFMLLEVTLHSWCLTPFVISSFLPLPSPF